MNTFKHHTFTPLYRNEAGWFTVPNVEALANAYWTLYPAEKGNGDLSPFENWLSRYDSSADPASGAIGTTNWYGKVTHALFYALFTTKAPRTRKEIIAKLNPPDTYAVFNGGPHLAGRARWPLHHYRPHQQRQTHHLCLRSLRRGRGSLLCRCPVSRLGTHHQKREPRLHRLP